MVVHEFPIEYNELTEGCKRVIALSIPVRGSLIKAYRKAMKFIEEVRIEKTYVPSSVFTKDLYIMTRYISAYEGELLLKVYVRHAWDYNI